MKTYLKVLLISSVLLLTVNLYSQEKKERKKNRARHSIMFTPILGGGINIINESGPDVFVTKHSFDFDIGYSLSKFYNHNRSQVEYGISVFNMRNPYRNMKLDFTKVMDLEYADYSVTYLFNREPPFIEWHFSLSVDYWHHFYNLKGNSFSVKAGFSLVSFDSYTSAYGIYISKSKLPNGDLKQIRFMKTNVSFNYISRPYLFGLNFGAGYNFRLWKDHKIRFALVLKYIPRVYFYGEYETTNDASFYAKGKFYKQPSELGFNISFTF